MRFALVLTIIISLEVHHVLSSAATGYEFVAMYFIYKMECMVLGAQNTRILADNLALPPLDIWIKHPYNKMPVHQRPKGSGPGGMLTYFEFEKDLVDPRRVDQAKYGYDMTDMSGGRNTETPDGDVIGRNLVKWKFGVSSSWRLLPEIYQEMLADWNAMRAAKEVPVMRYGGAKAAQKMGEVLEATRRAFEANPNKDPGLVQGFNDVLDAFKKNLDKAVMLRRSDSAGHVIDWYQGGCGWARSDLVIESQKLPDGASFDELNTDKTIAQFKGDATKLSKWQADTAALTGDEIRKHSVKTFKEIGRHIATIQAWQRVLSAARAAVPGAC